MIYLDASVLLPQFRKEATSGEATEYLRALPPGGVCISRWTWTEVISAIGQKVQMNVIDQIQADHLIKDFDNLIPKVLQLIVPNPADYNQTLSFMKNSSVKLRWADALHLAVVSNRLKHEMLTSDTGLFVAAAVLNVKARLVSWDS